MDCGVPEGRLTEVAERMADCRELPVEDPNDVRLCLVEDKIVDLVVAVDHRRPVFGLGCGKKTHLPSLAQPYIHRGRGENHFVELGNLPDWHMRVDILRGRLHRLNRR